MDRTVELAAVGFGTGGQASGAELVLAQVHSKPDLHDGEIVDEFIAALQLPCVGQQTLDL